MLVLYQAIKLNFLLQSKMLRKKFSPSHAMQAQKSCEGITILMLNLRAPCEWVVNAKLKLLYHREVAPSHVADETGWAGIDRNSEIKTS